MVNYLIVLRTRVGGRGNMIDIEGLVKEINMVALLDTYQAL